MLSSLCSRPDLWEYLQTSHRTVVLYGMGNGADKIWQVCDEKGIEVREVFASDGFVRGQVFHGKTVQSFAAVKEKYGVENLTVLLCFGSSRPEVLELFDRISAEVELLVPDVPVFGEGLFDRSFFISHLKELEAAQALLSDEESKRLFETVAEYKLTGKYELLKAAVSDRKEIFEKLVCPKALTCTLDLGAYTGDTVRELLAEGAKPEEIIAFEPDARNFRKLSEYAEKEDRTRVHPVRAAAWNEEATLVFDGSGNRNATLTQNRSSILSDRPMKTVELPALAPDAVLGSRSVDYIKFDVEGAEKEALEGCQSLIERSHPTLLVSLYHRNEDLFALPLKIAKEHPGYKGFYLRRFAGVPAWDLNLYVKKEKS